MYTRNITKINFFKIFFIIFKSFADSSISHKNFFSLVARVYNYLKKQPCRFYISYKHHLNSNFKHFFLKIMFLNATSYLRIND